MDLFLLNLDHGNTLFVHCRKTYLFCDIDDNATTTSTSKLAYTYRHPENDFNFSINSQLAQNFNNNTTTLTGPNSTFSLATITPFKGEVSNDSKWYNNVTLNYRNTFNSRFSYAPIDGDSAEVTFIDALFDPSKYEEATGDEDHFKYGFRQTASVGISRLLSSPFLNLSASANFNEY